MIMLPEPMLMIYTQARHEIRKTFAKVSAKA